MLTLRALCLKVLLRYKQYLGMHQKVGRVTFGQHLLQSTSNPGDLGDVPVGLLWHVLKQCSAEQLAAIEDATAYVVVGATNTLQSPLTVHSLHSQVWWAQPSQ